MKLEHKQISIYGISAILIFLALSLVLAYFTPFRDPITISFKRMYPGLLVGNNLSSVNDVEHAKVIGKRFGLSEAQALEKEVADQKAVYLADKIGIKIPNDAAADEHRFYTKGNENDYQSLLNSHYDGSERAFYKYVVHPQITDAQLRMKYYNDISGTSPAYAKAKALIERLSKGERFEDLARAESADKVTGQLGGDLGFYEAGQLIPELEDQISISALGEIRRDVIVSRLGYHIVYPVEYSSVDGKKMWHAKHILLVPEGYEDWLEKQTEGVRVRFFKQ